MKNRLILATMMATLAMCMAAQSTPPAAVEPVPTPQQVAWQRMETYAFVHFGPNTFLDQEWGYGDADPACFNPTRLDCEQWVRTALAAGMQGIILTAKHHDGFCLWPSRYTDYSIARSPYKGGQGDIVAQLAAACRKHGLKLGLYLSPWDRHQASYGQTEYVDYYYNQLEELLTQYGPLFEVWLDGANGGDGWYGGACEKRTIDRRTYYDWPRGHELVARLQPGAIIFSDGGPGCRWVGNEDGHAGETNWSLLRIGEVYPGYERYSELTGGHADGDAWVAAECDVSIRPGWFYHEREDTLVKSVDQLVDLYYRSVGHNATLLLNLPVNRDGLIHPIDSARAVAMHQRIKAELSHNLLAGAKVKASNIRDKRLYGTRHLTDGDPDTYWATADGVTRATLEFILPSPQRIDRLMLQEHIALGQRVRAFSIEYHNRGRWHAIDPGEETTTIGCKRLLRFGAVTTSRLRIRFDDSRGPLCISEVGAYCSPD